MKALFSKDKQIRNKTFKFSKKYFILRSLSKNQMIFGLAKKKALIKLSSYSKIFSKIAAVNRCVLTYNKKRFNKFTLFSRFLFLKLIRAGKISGFKKSSW